MGLTSELYCRIPFLLPRFAQFQISSLLVKTKEAFEKVLGSRVMSSVTSVDEFMLYFERHLNGISDELPPASLKVLTSVTEIKHCAICGVYDKQRGLKY